MEVKNTQDLSKLADICHKKGIKTLKFTGNGFELEFFHTLQPKRRKESAGDKIEVDEPITEDMLIDWSVNGLTGA